MTSIQLGDLAQSYQLRSENARLKREMSVIAEELASGRTADLTARVSGDLTPIAGIEHDLSRLAGYDTAVAESILLTDTLQQALEAVQSLTQDLSSGLLTVGSAQDVTAAHAVGIDARGKLETVVGLLGMQVGGRSMLSGVATDQPALAGTDVILDALRTATAGLTTADDVVAAVDAWFGPGGGFETVGYTGSATALAPVAVGRNLDVEMGITASDPRLRDVLAGLALGALVAEGSLGSVPAEKIALAAAAGERMLSTQSGLATLRAEVGTMQSTLEKAGQANSVARHALQLARAEIVSVDPYDSATRLEAAQTQLEALYALTARLGRLSLTDFLR